MGETRLNAKQVYKQAYMSAVAQSDLEKLPPQECKRQLCKCLQV